MNERIRFERYRLMVISSWPESKVKDAALASAGAALRREMPYAGVAEPLNQAHEVEHARV